MFLALVAILLALNSVVWWRSVSSTRIEVIASVKEQLDKIISDLSEYGRDAPESASASGRRDWHAWLRHHWYGDDGPRAHSAILQLKQARIVGIFDEDAGSVNRHSANSLSRDMKRQPSTPVSMTSPTMSALMPF